MTGDFEEIRALRGMLKQMQDNRDGLLKVVNALLLFHGGGEWTLERRAEWTALTGETECTTKTLCTFARAQLLALLPTPKVN